MEKITTPEVLRRCHCDEEILGFYKRDSLKPNIWSIMNVIPYLNLMISPKETASICIVDNNTNFATQASS